VDLPTLQRLLGHGHVSTTMRYLHLAHSHVTGATSPLELLDLPDLPTVWAAGVGAAVPGAGLAAILRRHGPTYLATHDLSVAKAKVWRAIVACRTAALGGHVETCAHCGVTRHVYHSCRNRHCPLCQTRAKEAWLAQRRRELELELELPRFRGRFTAWFASGRRQVGTP
jgi:hypothetical protein